MRDFLRLFGWVDMVFGIAAGIYFATNAASTGDMIVLGLGAALLGVTAGGVLLGGAKIIDILQPITETNIIETLRAFAEAGKSDVVHSRLTSLSQEQLADLINSLMLETEDPDLLQLRNQANDMLRNLRGDEAPREQTSVA